MFGEKFTIIRHHTECSFPMQKWSRARLRYGIHFWWLPNAKGLWPGPIQEIRDCSFSFESLRSLQTAFSSQVDYLQVARDLGAIRKSRSTSRLPGTNLLDEWIGDLPLIAEVVASQLAKITCPTGRQYIENRFQRQSASPGP